MINGDDVIAFVAIVTVWGGGLVLAALVVRGIMKLFGRNVE